MADDYILYYYDLCIAIIIVFLIFMINPFNISAMSALDASASFICRGYSNNAIIAKIENCELLDSHFHRVDLFSELSRNMTPPSSSSSSDLFESAEDTTIQEDVESSNTEADNLQNEATSGETNQSLSSPSSPSDLFLGNEEKEEGQEGQDGVENDADANIQGQDIITSEESPESNTNST
jgi:hypothetical protein